MTPERLAEIRELLQSENPDSIARYGTNGIYQYAKDVRTAAMDLLAEIATLRASLTALVTAAEKVVSREQHAIDGDTFPDDQLLDTVIELGDYRALSAALAAVREAKGEK